MDDRPAEHPRPRGENWVLMAGLVLLVGASPTARGEPRPPQRRHPGHRSIPDRAGRTTSRWSPARPAEEHPRPRGENIWSAGHRLPAGGASPTARGERRPRIPGRSSLRSIPDRAGRTARRTGGCCQRPEHPRPRGENGLPGCRLLPLGGASPTARGERDDGEGGPAEHRSIPDRAGRTRNAPLPSARTPEHPRPRGENWRCAGSAVPSVGASPTARGERPEGHGRSHPDRSIPDRAGRTSRP